MSILAIAAGTTGVTARVVTQDGRIAARGHQELRLHSPAPGWVEQSPEEIWQSTLAATRDCLRDWDGNAADLSGIGVTNQRESVVLWDRETLGSPRRAIGGPDRRTADICRRMRTEGHEVRVGELTGLQLDPLFAGSKLCWLAEHEPNTWALVEEGRYAIGTVDSYLVARMSRGTWHVTDVSNASRTLLFDLETGNWSAELCALFEVPRDALPEIVDSWGALARTDPRSFLDLDLPIAGIAGDQPAALFGQACFDVGDSRCTYDTTSSVLTSSSILTNTGTAVVRSDSGLLSTAAWRSPGGETTYAVEGAISASPVAIAFEVRDVAHTMSTRLTSLRVDGGAADDLLCQLQADLLDVPVLRPEIVETAPLGVAFMAGLGTGVWESTDELRETWKLDREFTPSGSANR